MELSAHLADEAPLMVGEDIKVSEGDASRPGRRAGSLAMGHPPVHSPGQHHGGVGADSKADDKNGADEASNVDSLCKYNLMSCYYCVF